MIQSALQLPFFLDGGSRLFGRNRLGEGWSLPNVAMVDIASRSVNRVTDFVWGCRYLNFRNIYDTMGCVVGVALPFSPCVTLKRPQLDLDRTHGSPRHPSEAAP